MPERSWPISSGSSPETAFKVVVLPAPLLPRSATIRPGGTVSESPRSTCTECWYTTSMFSIASAGAASPGELMPS